MSHASEAGQEQLPIGDDFSTGKLTSPKAKSQYSFSTSSTSSSASRAAARARAKVEAARASAPFIQREAELKLAEARLAAQLTTLQHEKEIAAALAEAEVFEAAAEAEAREDNRTRCDSVHATMQRTRAYVEQHSKLHLSDEEPPKLDPYSPSLLLPNKQNVQADEKEQNPIIESSTSPTLAKISVPTARQPERATPVVRHCYMADDNGAQQPRRPVPADHRQPTASSPFTRPNNSRAPLQPHIDDRTDMSDITRYLVRRELVNSGLIKFNDRPENYWAWKSSFQNATGGLNLSASEELDLLTKWLGNQSSEHIMRIRSVHVVNPAVGLEMAWNRLEECYGSPEVIERALFERLENFPKINFKDALKLRELGDLLRELESAKSEGYLPGLSYLDTSRGVKHIVEKLPYNLQERWLAQGSQYKEQYNVSFPPFAFFTDFICNEAKRRNDPSFTLPTSTAAPSSSSHKSTTVQNRPDQAKGKAGNFEKYVSVHKTEVASQHSASQSYSTNSKPNDIDKQCPIHRKPHPLKRCRGFRSKPLEERKAFLKENGICFRCCSSTTHLAKKCEAVLKCTECQSDSHIAALHPGPARWESSNPSFEHGGENNGEASQSDVTSRCTEVCDSGKEPRSCSKICLVRVYSKAHQDKAIKVYVILDDQSNKSLVRSEFFNLFQIEGMDSPYTLRTCAGTTETSGRRATGFMVESLDGMTKVALPTLIECNHMPDDRSEIPTPAAAQHHAHLRSIAHKIPCLDPDAQILLLLGRDILQVHKVREHRNGPPNAPYAQRLDLGWVVIGNVCLGSAHKPESVTSFRTNVLENGRPSLLSPCPKHLKVKEMFCNTFDDGGLGNSIFEKTKDDDKVGLSIEDRLFLELMNKEMFMDNTNSWVAPLPFRFPRPRLPDNREQALSRLASLQRTRAKKPEMKSHFLDFMQKIFDRDQAELAPTLSEVDERWYLPIFGVYHPRKPTQIRVVFDSSAQHHGISLNDVLLTGPDLNNTLLGVLLRFRREQVSVIADIEQMFHSFIVREDHRDFLRFFWFKDNNPCNEIVEYRMKVHVFGNSPSPAVAIYGLRHAAQQGASEYGMDAKHFVDRDFYVDDGLKSLPTAAEAISLLKRTQEMLAISNLRLHKIASNNPEVLEAFPQGDHAKSLQNLDFDDSSDHIQRSLGLSWDLKLDLFTFRVETAEKPFTRRGILATVNSLFDPLGLAAPVIIQGKFLLRELTSGDVLDWDSPLPDEKKSEWKVWESSLQSLSNVKIPRAYTPSTLTTAYRKELHIFSDASIKAIAAVAYLKVFSSTEKCHTGFVLGKAKLAPASAHTVPRLELGAAVLAVEMAELVERELDVSIDTMQFYTDSKVVLGYIYNQTRRFYVYVANRVQRIRKSTKPEQWHYICTTKNPADVATRSVPAAELADTTWLTGPHFLSLPEDVSTSEEEPYHLVTPDLDTEVRSHATTLSVLPATLGSHRFERFSSWKSLVRAITFLTHITQSRRGASKTQLQDCSGWHHCKKLHTAEELFKAEMLIIKCVQEENYRKEFSCLAARKNISKDSSLRKLNPYVDDDGLLRIGGRLNQSALDTREKLPLVIPGRSHVAMLLIRHYHEKVRHQGRIFTEGSIRTAGFWIVGARRCINWALRKCITCNKLRGRTVKQKMADLPPDRLSSEPPFTYVGLDVFGPWSVVTRRTRGGQANSKRWAVLFTCMSTRAVHIELIEAMDTSSFINALRRFFALRGPAKQIRSDCGTNFTGACKELQMLVTNPEEPNVRKYLADEGCTWVFNPPHSSHMGGVWERMIGISRRILDSMLMQTGLSRLSHEVLLTLMAEIVAIINARPLVPISSDPDSPFLLTPASLLTQKVCTYPPPPRTFDSKDLHRQQWRQVQHLANIFWNRWRREYLPTLQSRGKWQDIHPNLNEGDLVLLKDSQVKRNEWPMALVIKTFPDRDGKIRKVELKVTRSGSAKTFLRPVSETILLKSAEDM
ncbi:uncharacterized protein LOC144014155 [Festucalex cinctus]